MNTPALTLNWLAIPTAVLCAFIWGFLWYGPIMGKTWAKLMGLKMNHKPDAKFMVKALGLNIVGTLLTTYVLAHTVQIWRPSVWGTGQDAPSYIYGWMCGFFTWIGFYVPMQFTKITWEGRPGKLFFINSVSDFIILQIICQILANWR